MSKICKHMGGINLVGKILSLLLEYLPTWVGVVRRDWVNRCQAGVAGYVFSCPVLREGNSNNSWVDLLKGVIIPVD